MMVTVSVLLVLSFCGSDDVDGVCPKLEGSSVLFSSLFFLWAGIRD